MWFFATTSVFLLCMLISLVKNPMLKKFLSSTAGVVFGFYYNGAGYIVCIATFIVVYMVLAILPR